MMVSMTNRGRAAKIPKTPPVAMTEATPHVVSGTLTKREPYLIFL